MLKNGLELDIKTPPYLKDEIFQYGGVSVHKVKTEYADSNEAGIKTLNITFLLRIDFL